MKDQHHHKQLKAFGGLRHQISSNQFNGKIVILYKEKSKSSNLTIMALPITLSYATPRRSRGRPIDLESLSESV